MGLSINNELFIVLKHKHVKPGKGGAFARIKIKNAKTGQVLERTIKSVEAGKIDEAELEERKLQNLYDADNLIHFMDNTTYEEVVFSKEDIGEDLKFLQEDLEVIGLFFNNNLLKIILPIFIYSEISHTDPGFKGDTAKTGSTKPATIDTGATIQVPLFVNTGDKVKIDTRSGEYVERVKK